MEVVYRTVPFSYRNSVPDGSGYIHLGVRHRIFNAEVARQSCGNG